jgi:transposase-like protein
MERVPRQKYTKEFREQAVQLVQDQEFTIPEAARRLAMSDKTLANGCFEPGVARSRSWGKADGP